MAIKDWEQDDYNTWINKNGNEIDISRGNKKWFVFLTIKSNQKQISPELNSQNLAKRWAKNYMRNH